MVASDFAKLPGRLSKTCRGKGLIRSVWACGGENRHNRARHVRNRGKSMAGGAVGGTMRELNLPAEGSVGQKFFCVLSRMLTRMASAASVGASAISGGARGADCYFSELAREADLVVLIELFVEELPQRVARMKRAAGEQDWQEVARLAHQLKGAGGSHGFPQLTDAAWQVERAVRELGPMSAVVQALAGLEGVCERVRAGVPA